MKMGTWWQTQLDDLQNCGLEKKQSVKERIHPPPTPKSSAKYVLKNVIEIKKKEV